MSGQVLGGVPVLTAAHAVVAGPYTTIDLFHTGFGLATLVALLLPLVVTGVWVSVARRARPGPPSSLQPRTRCAGRWAAPQAVDRRPQATTEVVMNSTVETAIE